MRNLYTIKYKMGYVLLSHKLIRNNGKQTIIDEKDTENKIEMVKFKNENYTADNTKY